MDEVAGGNAVGGDEDFGMEAGTEEVDGDHGRSAETAVRFVVIQPCTSPTAAKIPRAITAAIRVYSIAVTPSSSFRNFLIFSIFFSPLLCVVVSTVVDDYLLR